MAKRKSIHASSAPEVIGPYSHAVRVGNLLFLAGQIALDPKTMDLVDGGFRDEVKQVFKNVEAVLKAADCTLGDVVKLTVYLTDLSNFEQVNAIMSEKFSSPYPARAAVGVAALPRGASIELDVIADMRHVFAI